MIPLSSIHHSFEQMATPRNPPSVTVALRGKTLLCWKPQNSLGRRDTSLGGSCSYLEHTGSPGQNNGFLRCWLQHIHICLGPTPRCSLFAELLCTNKMTQDHSRYGKPGNWTDNLRKGRLCPMLFKVSSWLNILWCCSPDPQGTSTQPQGTRSAIRSLWNRLLLFFF